MLFKVTVTFLAAVVLVLGGMTMGVAQTGGNGSVAGSQIGPGQGGANVGGSEFCSLNPGEPGLNQDEIDALLFIREEEKVVRDSYMVLGDLWGLVIFANISESEQSHMDAAGALIGCYGLTDPVIDEVGTFFNPVLQSLFDTLMGAGQKSAMDGLYVGALIEETDIADTRDSISITVHENIIGTYESIMCGSRNHLRAFIRQIESNGGSYEPAVLDPADFWHIAYSPLETDCGSS